MRRNPRSVHVRPSLHSLFLCSVVVASALAPACSDSSSAGAGNKIGSKDRVDAGSTGGDSNSSAGGGSGLFDPDAGLIADAQPPVIPDGQACGGTSIVAAPKDVNILLVIDESGSMTSKPTGFSTDKWSSLKTALATTLSAVQNDISFGLELFPFALDPKAPMPVSCDTNCCQMPAGSAAIQIPIEAGKTAVPKINTALTASAPGGGTPTASALGLAYDYFKTGGGSSLKGDRYVLLATDGGPDCNGALTCDAATCTSNLDNKSLGTTTNFCDPTIGGPDAKTRCLDDTATEAAITKLAGIGVKTFVVGIPGTEAYTATLDALAKAGGEENPAAAADAAAPSYFAVSASAGASGLADVLGSITKNLVTSCSLQLGSQPENKLLLNVYVDGTLVPENGDGWRLDTSTTPYTIELLGSLCDKVQTEGAESVQVVYGCKTRTR
jgi:hypothetical protein